MQPQRQDRQLLSSPLLRILLVLSCVGAAAAQGSGLAPGPQPVSGTGSPSPLSSPPAPPLAGPVSSPAATPTPGLSPRAPVFSPVTAPSSAPDALSPSLDAPGPAFESPPSFPTPFISPSSGAPPPDKNITWCTVREDEYKACLDDISYLSTPNFTWSCIQGESKAECMAAMGPDAGDMGPDLMTLEPGLAYFAFKKFSMKAILAEVYAYHAPTFAAVAVVNKQMCDENKKLKLEDFKGLKSCHSGYLTASGWNVPVDTLSKSFQVDPAVLNQSVPNDIKLMTSFFSASCAPSELNQGGICTACNSDGNSSYCLSANTDYAGEDGAFRCLMDGSGDIAFLRAKTPTLYSKDGRNSQSWSTKTVDEFMYLCPSGGCKSINDNYGTCEFATLPSNVVMTKNKIPEDTRLAIISTLRTANWTDTLYTGRNGQNNVLSVSTQGLMEVTQVTREYLGSSADVTQSVLDLDSGAKNLTVIGFGVMSRVPDYSLSFALSTVAMGILGVLYEFL